MHKTGTTSIQQTLANAPLPSDWHYLRIQQAPNQSISFLWMFHSAPHTMAAIERYGLGHERTSKERRRLRRKLATLLNNDGLQRVIISGEELNKIDPEGRRDLATFLRDYFDEIRVVAYVRAPASYLSSAFQMRVRTGEESLDPELAWPRYRGRLEGFDLYFGEPNVSLWKYDPRRFPNGCVVQDFCTRVGMTISAGSITRVNQRLSREAVAILCAYRRHGKGFGIGALAMHENSMLVRALQTVGRTRFRFASAITRPLRARHRDDVEWMEDRLGESLAEPDQGDEGAVASEGDLFQVSTADCEAFVASFESLAGVRIRPLLPPALDTAPQSVAAIVDTCRETFRRKPTTRLMSVAYSLAVRCGRW
jgi:hypothetical protein